MPQLFRNIFLVAADLVNETLEPGHSGHIITQTARNICVYFANDDLALVGSKVANLKNRIASRRLGHTGPENISKTPKNVWSVDCDEINNLVDPKGHSYFLGENGKPCRVIKHMAATIRSGRAWNQESQKSPASSESGRIILL